MQTCYDGGANKKQRENLQKRKTPGCVHSEYRTRGRCSTRCAVCDASARLRDRATHWLDFWYVSEVLDLGEGDLSLPPLLLFSPRDPSPICKMQTPLYMLNFGQCPSGIALPGTVGGWGHLWSAGDIYDRPRARAIVQAFESVLKCNQSTLAMWEAPPWSVAARFCWYCDWRRCAAVVADFKASAPPKADQLHLHWTPPRT